MEWQSPFLLPKETLVGLVTWLMIDKDTYTHTHTQRMR